MRVVVFGASGRLGRRVLPVLLGDKRVTHVVGVARRPPDHGDGEDPTGVEWQRLDAATDDLAPVLRGCDAVVHLAWAHDDNDARQPVARSVNVTATSRILQSVVEAQVQIVVYASSSAAYSPAAKDPPVDESYPTDGVASSAYSAQKAHVERMLDEFVQQHQTVRLVRLRPALTLGPGAADAWATGSRALRWWLSAVRDRRPTAVVPDLNGAKLQVVHVDDVAEAVRAGVSGSVVGPFNLAAEPPLDARSLGAALGARRLPVPWGTVRSILGYGASRTERRAQEGWIDLLRLSPTLDATRAARELDWRPVHSPIETVQATLASLDGAGNGRRGAAVRR